MINRKLLTILAFLAININNSKAQGASDFTNLYSFGDSFTAGDSWASILSRWYGFKYDNSNSFAVGGQTTLDLAEQLRRYQAANIHFDSNAIYAVFMGPSDLPDSFDTYQLEIIDNNAHGTIPQLMNGTLDFNTAFPQTSADINVRAQNMGNFIKTLADNNAKYIIFLNYFNDSLRQDAAAAVGVNAQEFSFIQNIWKNQYNKAMYTKIEETAPSANIIYIDNDRLVTEVTTMPNMYFTQDEIDGTYNNNGYFLDAHPTPAGHKIVAQYIESVIKSPVKIALLREIPLETGHKNSEKVRDIASINNSENLPAFQVQATSDFMRSGSNLFSKEKLGLEKSDTLTGSLIANYRIAENLSIGGQAEIINTKTDFINNSGKATIDEYVLSIHGIYNLSDPLFAYSNFGIGKLKYNIHRNIHLGIAQRKQEGRTSGIHHIATVGIGYICTVREDIKLIPYVSGNYQSVSLKSYLEKGQIQSTTMFFGIPKKESSSVEMGITVEKDFIMQNNSSVTSSATVDYSYDFSNNFKKNITGKVSDMPRNFVVPSYKFNKSSLYVKGSIEGNIYNTLTAGLNAGIKPIGKIKLWSVGLTVKKTF